MFDYIGFDESVVIPDGGREIGGDAFFGCLGLRSVTISDRVTSIGTHAFQQCRQLRSIAIPADVTSIGVGAFSDCKELKNVVLYGALLPKKDAFDFEHGLTITALRLAVDEFQTPLLKRSATLGYLENFQMYTDAAVAETYRKYAVSQRKKLLPVIFENDTVSALEVYAQASKITAENFEAEYLTPAMEAKAMNCTAFLMDYRNRHISAEDMEKQLEREFMKDPYNAADMKKIWTWKKLGDGTLSLTSYKGEETNVVIPPYIGRNVVSRLGECLFAPYRESAIDKPEAIRKNLSRIESVTIGENVTSIGDRALTSLENLRYVELPASMLQIESCAFSFCKSLQSITLPRGLDVIEYHVFGFCKNLQSITIPDGVRRIGTCAFECCENLQSITIPESVTEIGREAFGRCDRLQTIYGVPGSIAERYAKENHIVFAAIEEN